MEKNEKKTEPIENQSIEINLERAGYKSSFLMDIIIIIIIIIIFIIIIIIIV